MAQADPSQRRKRSRQQAGADHIRQALDEGKYQEQPGTRWSSVLDSSMVTRRRLSIRRLQQGGKFQCRELAADKEGKAVRQRVKALTVPAASECMFRDPEEVADKVRARSRPRVHFRPQFSTLETVDSFVSREWLFQMTVADRHDIKITGLNSVLGLLREAGDATKPRLFFVVPEDVFKSGFKGPQPLKTARGADSTAGARTEAHKTRQFVLCVPIVAE